MPLLSAAERRITLRLLAYWEKQRRGRDMPAEQDIQPDDIADLWDHCFIMHIDPEKSPAYRYSYIGKSIEPVCHRKHAQGLSQEDFFPHEDRISAAYLQVVSDCKPLIQEGEFENTQGDSVKYRQCLLPLGSTGEGKRHFRRYAL